MPRTKQRVSPARMSPEGLKAWTNARLTRDVVLNEALIDRFVANAAPGLKLAVRGHLEGLLREQRQTKAAQAAEADTFIASQVKFRGGVADVDVLVVDETPRVLIAELRQMAEAGGHLTAAAPDEQDSPR